MTTRQEQMELLAKKSAALERRISALQRLEPGYRGAGRIQPSELSSLLATQFFTANDGLLLLGPDCPMTSTSWTSLRGQEATISGAFHQVAGAWAGTRALVVEKATENLVTNPSFGDDTTGWATVGTNTIARSSTQSKHDGYSLKCTYQDSTTLGYYGITLTAAEHYASAWVWVPGGWDGGNIYLNLGNFAGASATVDRQWMSGDPTDTWYLLISHITPDAGDLSGHLQLRTNSAPTAGKYVYADGFQVEQNDMSTSTCIGSIAWCDWSGTAHDSTSTRTATEVDLDGLIDILKGSTWTFAVWVQMPFDSTLSVPYDDYYVADIQGTNRALIRYETDNQRWRFRDVTLSDTFSAGDWKLIIATYNATDNEVNLFVDGVEAGVESDTLGWIVPTAWGLGALYDGSRATGLRISAYAVMRGIFTAEQVAALYHRNAPLVDAGAFSAPVYDGRFVRLEVSEDDVSATPTDAELTAAFGAQPDGFMALLDDAGAGTTVYKVWRAGGSWWYESLTQAT